MCPQTRTPDAHFYTEARYKGTKSAVICPDYSEASKFADVWLNPKQGTDAALALAFGHVVLREYHLDRQAEYFEQYARENTDMPNLVRLVEKDGRYVPERQIRASDFKDGLGEENNPEWKTIAYDRASKSFVAPNGSIGFRWGESGKWNLEQKAGDNDVDLELSFIMDDAHDDVVDVGFPYFANKGHDAFTGTDHPDVLTHRIPVKKVKLADGEALVATVFDLFCANYGLDRGLGGDHVAKSYNDMAPYTPAWAEAITGVSRDKIIAVAREFATNAEKTQGRSMVILGAALNHWYHMDMNYRGIMNLLDDVRVCRSVRRRLEPTMSARKNCVLKPAGCHWLLGWTGAVLRGSMNSTSFFYAHTDQWRYETLDIDEILSPTAPDGDWERCHHRLQHVAL